MKSACPDQIECMRHVLHWSHGPDGIIILDYIHGYKGDGQNAAWPKCRIDKTEQNQSTESTYVAVNCRCSNIGLIHWVSMQCSTIL